MRWLAALCLLHFYLSLVVRADETLAGPRVDGNRTIGREGRIKQLLDRSLQYVQTISHGAYMTISRYPTSNWQLACEAIMSNFTCNVQLARMRVTLVSLVGVTRSGQDVYGASDEISILGISFILQGEIRRRGVVRLRETHSYVANDVSIPLSIPNMNAQVLLQHIMQSYNAKLRIYQLGEYVTRPN